MSEWVANRNGHLVLQVLPRKVDGHGHALGGWMIVDDASGFHVYDDRFRCDWGSSVAEFKTLDDAKLWIAAVMAEEQEKQGGE